MLFWQRDSAEPWLKGLGSELVSRLETNSAMTPPYCEVCGRCFKNQYHHVHEGGRFLHFADYDDSAAKQGCCPGVVGAAWVCDEHVPLALKYTHMPLRAAISDMREAIGVHDFEYEEGLEEPHLYIGCVGPSRPKVFTILRAATGMTPEQAKNALECLPVLVAKGWPASFRTWREELERCGALVRVVWD